MGYLSDFKRGQIVVARVVVVFVKKGHFFRCIQSINFQGYGGIHKSWDIIS
jgi:hypothetical protein